MTAIQIIRRLVEDEFKKVKENLKNVLPKRGFVNYSEKDIALLERIEKKLIL